ncbi:MAG: hypothetical protein KBF58_10945 [Methyloversatilis sp.]|nr:hypothetical protein [Methyloversatilis sp.]
MSDFSDYTEDKVLNVLFRGQSHTGAATVYAALFTAAPTDAGGGTECAYSGYARVAITFGAPSGGVIANSGTVTFTAAAGSSQTVVAIAIFDASTSGNQLAQKTLSSSITYNIGDIPIISVSGVTITAA